METDINKTSLDTLCAGLCYAMGVTPPEHAAPANQDLCDYVDKALNGKKADRIFMYNPDAIGQWISEKYALLMREATAHTDLAIPFCTVMPSVTPVCFGTMYTGAQPAVHGIRKYEKPVITIDTIFDAMIRAGKKCVIVGDTSCSMIHIFKEREMDYFAYETIEEINAKAAEIIMKDEYDFVAIYNGNYDSRMHRVGPEGLDALGSLRMNSADFAMFDTMIQNHWTGHNTLVGFAMDHGCHAIDGDNAKQYYGSHGLDMPEDLNIVHLYKAHPAAE